MKNLLFALLTGSFCCCYAQQKAAPVPEPEVVATPPADAGRGLIRVTPVKYAIIPVPERDRITWSAGITEKHGK